MSWVKRHLNSATGAVFCDAGTAERRGVLRSGAVIAWRVYCDASRVFLKTYGGGEARGPSVERETVDVVVDVVDAVLA